MQNTVETGLGWEKGSSSTLVVLKVGAPGQQQLVTKENSSSPLKLMNQEHMV